MAYRDVWPDANGYPVPSLEKGQSVYVVDITHAWPATFVGYKNGKAYVKTPGGEVVSVETGSLRRALPEG